MYGINQFLEKMSFKKNEENLVWIRNLGGILHLLAIELTGGKNIRIKVFVVSKDSPYMLGGNLTKSSVEGKYTIGGDYVWDISQKENWQQVSNSIINTMRCVAIPWLSVFLNKAVFDQVVSNYENESLYRVSDDFLKYDVPIIKSDVLDLNYKLINSDTFARQYLVEIKKYMKNQQFKQLDNDQNIFLRKRQDIYDVIMIQLINDGLHFGAYAFSWIEDLAIDGSGVFNRENALMLNGGIISHKCSGHQKIEAFLIGSHKEFQKSLLDFFSALDSDVIPYLSLVNNKRDFFKSIKPEHQIIAAQIIPDYQRT